MNPKLKYRKETIQSATDSKITRKADSPYCPICNCNAFHLFKFKEDDHDHLVCAECQQTYCPSDNLCKSSESMNPGQQTVAE